MSITHIVDTDGKRKSKRFEFEKPLGLNLDALEHQVRAEKAIGNSKTRVYLCDLQQLIDAARLGLGVRRKPDLRRTIGETGDDQ